MSKGRFSQGSSGRLWSRLRALWRPLLPVGTLVFLLLHTSDASANYLFCTVISAGYTDADLGEDYLGNGTNWGAAYHRLDLYRNDVLVGSKYAGANGCYPDKQTAAGNYKLVAYTKMQLGNSTVTVHLADPASFPGWWKTFNNLPASPGAATTVHLSNPGGSAVAGAFRVSLAAGVSMGVGKVQNSNYRIFAEVPDGGIVINGQTQTCPACVVGSDMFLGKYNGVWLNKDRSTILHEYGHLLQGSLFGAFLTPDVAEQNTYCAAVANTGGFDACRCDQVDVDNSTSPLCGNEFWDRLHCLNSREYMHAAFGEGWAHFRAAYVLNNPTQAGAIFPYYKDTLTSNLTQVESPVPVQVDPTTPVKWMENKCSDDTFRRGTELDWVSFFYRVGLKSSEAYSLGHFQTVFTASQTCNGACTASDTVDWNDLEAAVNAQAWTDAKKNHFIVTGDTYGVNH